MLEESNFFLKWIIFSQMSLNKMSKQVSNVSNRYKKIVLTKVFKSKFVCPSV